MKRLFFIMIAAVLCGLGVNAKTVTGTVLDAVNNEPLVGATVLPIGGGQGVATDVDGNFSITVPDNVKTAKVSYVGYTPQVAELKDGMKVYLSSSASNLDDVVVIAYGTASKESLTGSVAVVNSEEIEKRPVSSVTSALEGMAPGVQVNGSTGTPGSSPSILIRGVNTVNGTTAPLYVVDGVVYTGSISDLNPNDVENISVLKDAASCALYGAKGANGVVLISTRRAKKSGKIDVTVKMRQGIYQRGLPQYDRLGYDQWNETYLQALTNGNYSAAALGTAPISREEAFNSAIDNFFSSAGVFNLYDTHDANGNHNIGGDANGIFDKDGKVIVKMMPGYTDLDWWDAISRNGHRQEYNVSATGASEKYNVFASVGYLDEQGYILKTDFERWTARLRAEFNPTKYFKFGVNFGGTAANSDQPQFSSSSLSSTSNPFSYQTTAPGLPFYEHDWNTGKIKRDANGNPIWNVMDGYPALVSNRGLILRSNDDYYERLAIDANAFATITLPYGFDLTLRGTMNRYRQESSEYSGTEIGSAKGFGRLAKYFYNNKIHTFQQTLTWTHEYGSHHVDAMLNHENYNKYYNYTTLSNRDEIFPGMDYINNFPTNESTNAYAYQYRTESYMGRARYNYNQQYFFETSLNRDGSSRFAKDQRWGTFWSVGASWIISKEKFMQDLTWLDFLKARLSYGTAGSDYTKYDGSVIYYPAWDTWDKSKYTLYGNPSIFPGVIGNPSLHWEATKTFDAALEGNLLNNRLNFSVGYFIRSNNDLIYSVSQAPSNGTNDVGGTTKIIQNVGDMHNYGWELSFGGDIIRNKDLTLNAHIDATFIKNKITKLPAGNIYSTHALIEGKSRYEWYIPKWAGVDMMTGNSLYEINMCHKWETEKFDDNGKSLGWFPDEEKFQSNLTNAEKNGALVKIGDKYYTTNTSYASNEFCGTSLPTVYGSFGTNLSWKGLTAGLLFTYSLGGKTLNSNYSTLVSVSSTGAGAMHKDLLNSWTRDMAEGISEDSPNRINNKILPALDTYYNSTNNYGTSSRFLMSSSYLALKNVNVAYDLPKNWVKPLSVQNVNLGLSIDNVFIATKKKGMNPTYNLGGEQGNYFVASRVYSFELTVRF